MSALLAGKAGIWKNPAGFKTIWGEGEREGQQKNDQEIRQIQMAASSIHKTELPGNGATGRQDGSRRALEKKETMKIYAGSLKQITTTAKISIHPILLINLR